MSSIPTMPQPSVDWSLESQTVLSGWKGCGRVYSLSPVNHSNSGQSCNFPQVLETKLELLEQLEPTLGTLIHQHPQLSVKDRHSFIYSNNVPQEHCTILKCRVKPKLQVLPPDSISQSGFPLFSPPLLVPHYRTGHWSAGPHTRWLDHPLFEYPRIFLCQSISVLNLACFIEICLWAWP